MRGPLSLPSFRPALAPNPDGSPWWARVFRITNVRVVTQAFFFALFVFLLGVTWLSRLGGYPASLFLEIDPLHFAVFQKRMSRINHVIDELAGLHLLLRQSGESVAARIL